MPRKRRAWSPDLFYHVVMRGNNRQEIFRHAEDYAEFFRSLYYTYDRYPFEIVAYCIMNNHYHLLIRSPNESLSKVMGTLNKRYSDYFKRKYHYCGHLYESRYFAEATMDAKGILAASRSIHRTPIATEKPMVERMEHYPYSSYYLYKTNPIISPIGSTFLPSCMPVYSKQMIEDYCLFCEQDEKEMND